MKPILCLDFDGVCHSYNSGWKGADVIPDKPVPGLFEFIDMASEHFEINVFSSRSHQPGGISAMRSWFVDEHLAWFRRDPRLNLSYSYSEAFEYIDKMIKFPTYKPSAQITIDDRAITFNGTWPDLDYLKNFKPWYK